jgi:PAS domain S-box-containing protein
MKKQNNKTDKANSFRSASSRKNKFTYQNPYLKDSMRLTQLMFNKVETYFMVLSRYKKQEFYFDQVNNAYASAHKKKPDDFLGQPLKKMSSKEEYSEFINLVNNAKNKGSYSIEKNIKTKKGVRQHLFRCFYSLTPEGYELYIIASSDITNQNITSKELEDEKNKIKTYLNITGVMLIVIGTDYKVKMINKKGCQILGYKQEDIIGKNYFTNFLPVQSSRLIKKRFDELMRGKKPSKFFENSILTSKGTEKLIYWHSKVIKDEKNRAIGLLSSGEDITKQKALENNILWHSRTTETLYKLSNEIAESIDMKDLLNRISSLLATEDEILYGNIYLYNEQSQNFQSSNPFCKKNKNFAEAKTINYKDKFVQNIIKVKLLIDQVRDKSYKKQFLYKVSILLKIKNEILGILVVILDKKPDSNIELFVKHLASEIIRAIKRKKVDAAHKASEEKFSTIFNTTPDAIAITSIKNPVFLEVNTGFIEITGFTRKEVLGKPVSATQTWDDFSEREKMLKMLLKNKVVSGFEAKLVKKDKTKFNALFSAKIIEYNGQLCVLSIVKDITDRSIAEEEIAATKQMLEKITDASPAFISVYDMGNDNIIYSNKSIIASLGYSARQINEIRKMTVTDRMIFYHPDDVSEVNNMDKKILTLKDGEIIRAEYRLKDFKGNWCWFEHSAGVFQRNNYGTPTHSVNIISKIDVRKKGEELVLRKNEQIKILYEAGKELGGTLNLTELYDRMYSYVSQIADCDELFVATYAEKEKLIKYFYLRSKVSQTTIDVSNIPPIPLAPPGFGILSGVIRSGQTLILNDYQNRFKKSKVHYTIDPSGHVMNTSLNKNPVSEYKPQSALIVPIKLDNKVFGVVQIFSTRLNAFTKEQGEFVEALMHQVALANKNVILYQQAQEEIHVRKIAEDSLRESENQLRVFAESIPDVLYKLNLETNKYEYLSQAIEKLLGYSINNFLDNTLVFFKKRIYPEDIDNLLIKFNEYINLKNYDKPLELVYRMIKANGETIWVRELIQFEFENDVVKVANGVLSNITDQINMQEENRERNERTIAHQAALLQLSKLYESDLTTTFSKLTEIVTSALKINRTSIWLFKKEKTQLVCKDEYDIGNDIHTSGIIYREEQMPKFFAMLKSDEKILNADPYDQRLVEFMSERFSKFGINASIITRIRLYGDIIGILCFEMKTNKVVDWTPEQSDFGMSVSNIVTLSLETEERRKAEHEIKKSLHDKELLLREIHHRVKNNLQIVTSLLYLQSRKSNDEQVIEALRVSEQRIRSMVLIHEKLYRSKDLARIDYVEYVKSLTNSLFTSYSLENNNIELVLDVQEVNFDIDVAIQCGLIINELVSNSIKHAFPNNKQGKITVRLFEDTLNNFNLFVSDDGVGIKTNPDYLKMDTLGLRLVNTLVEQIDGKLEIEGTNGTSFNIIFPKINKTEHHI